MIQKFHHSERDSILLRFKQDGFVIVKGLIEDGSQLNELKAAADDLAERTRNHQWPYKRTVGKQFPPWNHESMDVWGVQHIMHPAVQMPIFSDFYFSKPMLELTSLLSDLSTSEDSMAGLFNLLIEPLYHRFELGWHRDSIQPNVDEKEEREHLFSKAKYGGIQWNLALLHDECLFVVPGSHSRLRSPIERQLTSQVMHGMPQDMPDAMCASLAPGDAVFYNSQILHRGTYNPSSKRRTLHGAHLDFRADTRQAGDILQHFEPCGMYYNDSAFLDTLPKDSTQPKEMVDRLLHWSSCAKKSGYNKFVQENV